MEDKTKKTKSSEPKQAKESKSIICPKCKEGNIIKGKSAYGCSNYTKGCHFKVDFIFNEKKLTEKQIYSLIQKKKTPLIKGFVINDKKVNGKLILASDFNISFEQDKKEAVILTCPICKSGTIIKGKSAYGCNKYQEGCHFVIPFEALKEKHNTDKLSPKILSQWE